MSLGKFAATATAAACMTVLSIGWSAQQGVSLSVDRAQAVESHAKMERHAAVSHRHYRHMAHRTYGRRYAPGPVEAGADIAAGAVNTAGAIAAGAIGTAGAIAAAPFGAGTYAAAPYEGPYYASSPWGDYDCTPGAGPYECRPWGSKDWYHH